MEPVPPSEVTVVIPAHLPRVRNGMLERAVRSVWSQTAPPGGVIVAVDHFHQGAAATRQRGLEAVKTRYVAFLDSDDELLPNHLEVLLHAVNGVGASYVYSWFEAVGMSDPLGHFGLPFNPRTPHHTTMTILCDTKIAQDIGFRAPEPSARVSNEDWLFILEFSRIAVERDLVMTHVPERTWRYHYHVRNTSGMPNRGDAGERA